jgi:hypothetical protein
MMSVLRTKMMSPVAIFCMGGMMMQAPSCSQIQCVGTGVHAVQFFGWFAEPEEPAEPVKELEQMEARQGEQERGPVLAPLKEWTAEQVYEWLRTKTKKFRRFKGINGSQLLSLVPHDFETLFRLTSAEAGNLDDEIQSLEVEQMKAQSMEPSDTDSEDASYKTALAYGQEMTPSPALEMLPGDKELEQMKAQHEEQERRQEAEKRRIQEERRQEAEKRRIEEERRQEAEKRRIAIEEDLNQAKEKLSKLDLGKNPSESKPKLAEIKDILQKLKNHVEPQIWDRSENGKNRETLKMLESGCSKNWVTKRLNEKLEINGYLPGKSEFRPELEIKRLAIGESVHIMKKDIKQDTIFNDYYFNPKYTSLNPEIMTFTCLWPGNSLDDHKGGRAARINDMGRGPELPHGPVLSEEWERQTRSGKGKDPRVQSDAQNNARALSRKFEAVKGLAAGNWSTGRVFEAWADPSSQEYPTEMKLMVINLNGPKGGTLVGGYDYCGDLQKNNYIPNSEKLAEETDCALPTSSNDNKPKKSSKVRTHKCMCVNERVIDGSPIKIDAWGRIYAEILTWKPTHVVFEDTAGCGRAGNGVAYLFLQQWLNQNAVDANVNEHQDKSETKTCVTSEGGEVQCSQQVHEVLAKIRGKELSKGESPRYTESVVDRDGIRRYTCLVEEPKQVEALTHLGDEWFATARGG